MSPGFVEGTFASTVATGAEWYQEPFVGAVPANYIGERKRVR